MREGYSNLSQSTRLYKERKEKKKQQNQLRTAIAEVIKEQIASSKKRKAEKQVRFAEEDEDEDEKLFAFHNALEHNSSDEEDAIDDVNLDELSLNDN